MGFLDEIRSYFRNDEPTPTEQAAELNRQRREDQFGDLPNEIEEMPPEDVADTFARMQQDDRLAFVRNRSISKEKWDEMMSMIESNSKQQDFWGIDDSQTEIQDGVSVCICHEEEVQTWTETRGTQKTIGQTQGTSKTSKTEAGSKVSGSGGVGILALEVLMQPAKSQPRRGEHRASHSRKWPKPLIPRAQQRNSSHVRLSQQTPPFLDEASFK
ncbi:hypothetical protein ACFQJ8_26205 [Halocatena marina]|uniref:hypothetical protein n=1 Tax=Halocatena marina TaxID=2934937 RepID=UPI0036189C6A